MWTSRQFYGALQVAALTSLFPGSVRAQNADQCRDVLQDGIRDQYSVTSSANMKSAFKNGFCNSTSNSSGSSTGAGLGVSVPLADAILGIKGNYSQDQQQAMKNKYCGNSSSDLSNDDYESMMKRVASVAVIQAWAQCMHDRAPVPPQAGLVSDVVSAGASDFVFRFRWIAGFQTNSAKVKDFFPSHATCSGPSISKGATIGTGWSVAQCTRQGNDAVMITVEADDQLGATTQTLPAITQTNGGAGGGVADPLLDLKKKCMGGAATACQDIWNATKDKCGTDVACIGQSQCWMDKARALTLIKTSCQPGQNPQSSPVVCQAVQKTADLDCENF
jgi:hypothetical protein